MRWNFFGRIRNLFSGYNRMPSDHSHGEPMTSRECEPSCESQSTGGPDVSEAFSANELATIKGMKGNGDKSEHELDVASTITVYSCDGYAIGRGPDR